jgi:YbbR domain-containing protein
MTPLRELFDGYAFAGMLRRNLAAKVFAIAFAFLLWFFVNSGQRETQDFEFPLELRNAPDTAVLINANSVQTIAVRLNGPAPLLASLDTRRVPIVLDLTGIEAGGERKLKISEDMIRVPRGVRIIDVDPSRVPIRLEPIERATVPVRLAQVGKLPNGFKLESVTTTPPEVVIRGPAPLVQAVRAVETEPFDVTNLTGSTTRQLALVPGDEALELRPERVSAHVVVQEVLATRELARVQVEVRNVDRDFQLEPPRVTLTVRGPERIVRELALGDGSVYVEGGGFAAGEHQVRPEVMLPAGVELVKRAPAVLRLRIAEAKAPPKDDRKVRDQ